MNEKKITVNFDSNRLVVDKKVPISKGNPKGRPYTWKKVPVKNPKAFEVTNIVNSVDYVPGQKLTKKEVENLCLNKKWLVEIIKTEKNNY
jgi:hypothetical protein